MMPLVASEGCTQWSGGQKMLEAELENPFKWQTNEAHERATCLCVSRQSSPSQQGRALKN